MEFAILGPVEARSDGRTVELTTALQRTLGVLLIKRNQTVTHDELAVALHGNAATAAQARNAKVSIARLRKALGDASELATVPGGYCLIVGPDGLDADRFERLVQKGRRAARGSNGDDPSATLDAAESLWRGPPFAGLDDEPFQSARAELEAKRVELVIDVQLASGRHDADLLVRLEHLVEQDHARQHHWWQYVVASYRCGRRDEAVEVYRRALVALKRRAIAPGKDLTDLWRDMDRNAPWLEPPPPPAPPPAGAPPPAAEPGFPAGISRASRASTAPPARVKPARVAVTSAAAAAACLLSWLLVPARPDHWTVNVRATSVDDALSVQVRPCSATYPQAQLIAPRPDRVPHLAGKTVSPEFAIRKRVTAQTVITLQLYNDGGTGGARGIATDNSGREIFAFTSPRIADGLTERVWAASWYGDGRPAPLDRGCALGLPVEVRAMAAPDERPRTGPAYRPAARRRTWLLTFAEVAAAIAALATLVAGLRRSGHAASDPRAPA